MKKTTNKILSDKKDLRWRQRFQNYTNSFEALKRGVEIENPSETERGGIIQFYEVTFELARKMIKDYLESEGYLMKSPRETIKQAFQNGIIEDGEMWLEALDDRNLTTHIYDSEIANKIVHLIKTEYFFLLKNLHLYFSSK